MQCPKLASPSAEQVDEYHARYVAETVRIYDTYKNMYGWTNKPLIIA